VTNESSACHGIYHSYWTDSTIVHEEWTIATLRLLYKGKGDSAELKNYRGIVLQDLFARIMSSIVNFRLTTLIEKYGLDEQFGYTSGKGTTDALFAIRTALQLRREHQLPTYALFVDLIKGFDTANHELLFALLLRFGAPEGLILTPCRASFDLVSFLLVQILKVDV
jgi:hypothetical protein